MGVQCEISPLDLHPEVHLSCKAFVRKKKTMTRDEWANEVRIRQVRCCATCRYGYFVGGEDGMFCHSSRAERTVAFGNVFIGLSVLPGELCDDYVPENTAAQEGGDHADA